MVTGARLPVKNGVRTGVCQGLPPVFSEPRRRADLEVCPTFEKSAAHEGSGSLGCLTFEKEPRTK
jgi:hypothetical protein